jgi:hypothetical protein
MDRPLRLACAVSAALVVSACDEIATNPDDVLQELAAARARWDARGPQRYAVTQSRVCFCSSPFEWTVVVQGEEPSFVASVTDDGTWGDARAVDEQALAAEQAFDWIESVARTADRLDVAYDEQLGFPTRIVYDGSRQAADDEIERTFSEIVEIGACTLIGCIEELFILTLQPAGAVLPEGTYSVRVTASGAHEQLCCFVVEGGEAELCSATPYCHPPQFLDPPSLSVFLALPAGPFDLTVEREGSVVAAAADLEPAVARFRPNGPLCPPVCYQARHEMVIP